MNVSGTLHNAYVALGSNMGGRADHLADARRLMEEAGIQIVAASSIYETDPVGYTEQAAFLNQVCRVRTASVPEDLLKTLLNIENRLGRKRLIHWGPRTIDLDLLLYDDMRMDTDFLTLPHPRMFERAFILVPLRDVLPGGQLRGKSMENWIAGCADQDGVRPYAPQPDK